MYQEIATWEAIADFPIGESQTFDKGKGVGEKMLLSIHVKNLALIQEQEIEFGRGLNILTGETGAGKSVIIGSVNLALGGKADKSLIREGEDSALVELVFSAEEEALACLRKMELPIEDNGEILIQRKMTTSRSISRINGETVTTKQLQELSQHLISIHGQHDNQILLHKQKHLEILDDYAGDQMIALKEKLSVCYRDYLEGKRELESSHLEEQDRKREADLAAYEVEEIENAAPEEGEDERLEARYHKMLHARKIAQAAGEAFSLVEEDGGGNVPANISSAIRLLSSVSAYDDQVNAFTEQLTDIEDLLNDFTRGLSGYLSDLEFDETDFSETEDRLNLLNHLKDKYGSSLEEVAAYLEERRKSLYKLQNLEAFLKEMEERTEKKKKEALLLAQEISNCRKKASRELSSKMKKALLELNFTEVAFEVRVLSDPERLSGNGFDEAEFMISLNPGEEARPLQKIASGGELSRIMLALKTVFAGKEEIDTMIFDEIDAGISGRTAWKISQKLGLLAKGRQVICITHLPQIASMADEHFYIEKKMQNGRSVTTIGELDEEGSTRELARLLGADKISESALENAREMRIQALSSKA